jgi:hypothetical protein
MTWLVGNSNRMPRGRVQRAYQRLGCGGLSKMGLSERVVE